MRVIGCCWDFQDSLILLDLWELFLFKLPGGQLAEQITTRTFVIKPLDGAVRGHFMFFTSSHGHGRMLTKEDCTHDYQYEAESPL